MFNQLGKEIRIERIYIPRDEAKLLSIEEGCCPDYDEDALIYIATAKFPSGVEADIKLCNGDTPWVDPVLFDKDGKEIFFLDPDEDFFGEFCFKTGNHEEYVVIVREEV